MKKTFLFILSICLSIDANAGITIPAPAAWIDFSNNTSSMISFSQTNDQGQGYYTENTVYEGVNCRKIPTDRYLYLQINRSAVPSTARNLIVAITYFDEGNNHMPFQYNSVGNGDGAAFKSSDIKKNNNREWTTAYVVLTDAELAAKMFGSDDIRIGGLNYIRKISVSIGVPDPLAEPVPPQKNLPGNQFKGRSFAGYQMWHHAGLNDSDWSHWSYGHKPGQGYNLHNGVNICSYPDLSEYEDDLLYQTNLGPLGNGRSAGLYHAKDAAVIQKQMEWLKDADLDGVVIQRFVGGIGGAITSSEKSYLTYAKKSCEKTGRLFFLGYDLNGADDDIVERLQRDWVYEIEQNSKLTSSTNYATVNGKPVVEIWGIGHNMATAEQCARLINFLKSRGCYVIGGTPRDWRTSPGDGFTGVFKLLNCISPWTVGVYGDINGANHYKEQYMIEDLQYCTTNRMDYLPVVFAGSGNWLNDNMEFSQTRRNGGEFFWRQIQNAKSLGLSSVFYAMLDEFEENTNLIKGAVDYFDLPINQFFETFSRDGIWVSSDYYLRLAAHAAKALREEIPLTAEITIPYSEGPVYYRNSFESRLSTINKNGSTKDPGQVADYQIVLPIDPCFYKDKELEKNNVNGAACSIEETSINRNGNYAIHFTGNPVAGQFPDYSYQIAEVKIDVKEKMELSFWKYTGNEAGIYTSVDLLFKSGKRLSNLNRYMDNHNIPMNPQNGHGSTGAGWEKFSCTIGEGELLNDVITGIIISYKQSQSTGMFNAYFDDIIIADGIEDPASGIQDYSYPDPGISTRIYSRNNAIYINTESSIVSISIFNVSGQKIYDNILRAGFVSLTVSKGVYIAVINENRHIVKKKIMVR